MLPYSAYKWIVCKFRYWWLQNYTSWKEWVTGIFIHVTLDSTDWISLRYFKWKKILINMSVRSKRNRIILFVRSWFRLKNMFNIFLALIVKTDNNRSCVWFYLIEWVWPIIIFRQTVPCCEQLKSEYTIM